MPRKEQFGITQPLSEETLYELMNLMEIALETGNKEIAPRVFVSIVTNLLGEEVEKLSLDTIQLEKKPHTSSSYTVRGFKKERALSSFQLKHLSPYRSFEEFDEARKAGFGELKWFLIFTESGTHFCQFDEDKECWWSTTLKVSLKSEAGERWPKLMATLLQRPLKPSSS